MRVRVALAVNDLGSATYLLGNTKECNYQGPPQLRGGLELYAIRLWCGHLHEAVQLIGKIYKTEKLQRYIVEMPHETQEKYELLRRLQKGESDHQTYVDHITTVRDKLIFHYDPGEICLAIGQITRGTGESFGYVATKEIDSYPRFMLADTIMRRELCSVVWGVENTTPEEIDRALIDTLDLTHKWVQAFHVFGTELCTRYFAGLQPEVRNKAVNIVTSEEVPPIAECV